jgi:hypothetical protein
MKKEKETKSQKKIIKTEKRKKKEKTCKKSPPRRVNGPAQHRAHAGGAEFRSANGRSIGFPVRNSGAPILQPARWKTSAAHPPMVTGPGPLDWFRAWLVRTWWTFFRFGMFRDVTFSSRFHYVRYFFGRFSCTYYAILKKWRFIFLQVPFHELFHYMFKKSKDEASKNWRVIFLQVKNLFQLVLFHIKIKPKNKNKQISMDYKI